MFSLTLKALVALSNAEVADEVCAILAKRGIPYSFQVESTQQAIAAMMGTRFHLFIVDAHIPVTMARSIVTAGGVNFIRFIRMCAGEVSEATVIFLRSESGRLNIFESSEEIYSAEAAGASRVMSQPFTSDKFDAHILPLISEPRPFVRSSKYIGPSRRTKDAAITIERRKETNLYAVLSATNPMKSFRV